MLQTPETVLLDGDPALPVLIRPSGTARRLSLRVSGLDGKITLSVPRGLKRQHALGFLAEKEAWLRAAVARAPEKLLVRAGSFLPVDGQQRMITLAPIPRVSLDGDRLLVPNAAAQLGPRVAAYLKLHARDRLVTQADHYATMLGRRVTSVSLRDTRSRWGSCTAQGRLMFCWRLAMAPQDVQDYVAAHEAAHLVHMDHSRAYWDTVARIMPDYAVRRAWLRTHGAQLHSYVFDNG
jgi:predicted metal-dependent hydrolase